MPQESHRQKLDAVVKRRDDLQRKVDRAEGRLEAARNDLAKVEGECKAKKLAPGQLDEAIEKLETRYTQELSGLEEQITHAEEAVGPFVEEST